MILRKNYNGDGKVGNYTLSIGAKEARSLKFLDDNGNSLELEKVIDIDNSELRVKLKKN